MSGIEWSNVVGFADVAELIGFEKSRLSQRVFRERKSVESGDMHPDDTLLPKPEHYVSGRRTPLWDLSKLRERSEFARLLIIEQDRRGRHATRRNVAC